MKSSIRITVVGAGSVGGLMAYRLAGAGHAVSVIARGDHLVAIQKAGLRVIEGPEALVDALGAGLAESIGAGGCEVTPVVTTSTVGIGPAIGTIDITIGCDPTTDAGFVARHHRHS